jgi:two-component system, LytTR family, sensor kinase
VRTAVTWGALFLASTAVGFLSFSYRYLDDLAGGRAGTFAPRLLEEATGVYAGFVLLPLAFRVMNVYLFERTGWPRRIVWHLVAAVGFSFVHTSLMAVSRAVLFPALGLGVYDYGIMRFRYPMELSSYLIGFTMVTALYYAVARLRLAHAQQVAAAELRTKLAEAQLENLRLQIQPHFLFNTLNTISSVMYDDLAAADAMLADLSELLRLTLRTSGAQEIPLAEELRITRLYLGLMHRRFDDRLRVTYMIGAELDDALVPQFLLQPIVENCLRHAWPSDHRVMDLSVTAHRHDGALVLQVRDTGVGVGPRNTNDLLARGLGLSTVHHRLDQLYGALARLVVANREGGGTDVTLRLPYRSTGRQEFRGA